MKKTKQFIWSQVHLALFMICISRLYYQVCLWWWVKLSIYSSSIFLQTEAELVSMQRLFCDNQLAQVNNIAALVLSPESSLRADEDSLIMAVEGKYDALRDQLIMEALMNQVGGIKNCEMWQFWIELLLLFCQRHIRRDFMYPHYTLIILTKIYFKIYDEVLFIFAFKMAANGGNMSCRVKSTRIINYIML